MMGDIILPEPANPGASATKTVYDSSASGQAVSAGDERRAKVFIFANQIVTVKVYAKSAAGTYRQINGAGDATTASTAFTKEYGFYGNDHKIDIVTTTAPTTWECTVRISSEQAALT